jgi:hypothetical protein
LSSLYSNEVMSVESCSGSMEELRLEAMLNHYLFSGRLKVNSARRSVVHGCFYCDSSEPQLTIFCNRAQVVMSDDMELVVVRGRGWPC